MASHSLIITSVLVVALGYLLYTPLPEGIAEPWKLRAMLATLKIMNAATYVGDKLGLDSRLNLTRKLFGALASSSVDPRVETADMSFDGVKVRVYRPKEEANTVLPGLVYYHGGGWVFFSVGVYDGLTSYIAAEANIAVVSVEYRLAPEYPFPAPFDDCVTATVHLLRNAKNYKIDAGRIGVAGDSAGGNLAAAVALKLRDDKMAVLPKIQCLIYPALQAIDLKSPSRIQNVYADGLLTNAHLSYTRYLGLPEKYADIIKNNNHISSSLRRKYSKFLDYKTLPAACIPVGYKPMPTPSTGDVEGLPEKDQQLFVQSYLSPLLTEDLKGMPKTYIFSAGGDTLRDDGYLYAERLERAGVLTKHVHLKDTFHGVFSIGLKFEARELGRKTLIAFIKEYLK